MLLLFALIRNKNAEQQHNEVHYFCSGTTNIHNGRFLDKICIIYSQDNNGDSVTVKNILLAPYICTSD